MSEIKEIAEVMLRGFSNCETLPPGGYWGTMVANNYDKIKAVIPSLQKFPMSEPTAREYYMRWCRETDYPVMDMAVLGFHRSFHPHIWQAFVDLYNGMNEANENGTGYSPKVATAMYRLKMYFGERIQSGPSETSPVATPYTSRD